MNEKTYDVIIIGSGPAGLTAALYTSRGGLSTLIIGGNQPGGQLTTTTLVENYPGFPEGIQGPKLMQDMIVQATKFGAEIKYGDVKQISLDGNLKKVSTEFDEEYVSKTLIIATGAKSRILNIPGENTYWGKGVSTCATCDGALCRDKKVMVVGGGDSAMEDSLFLANLAAEVIIVHRRDQFRASQIMQERVKANPKIKIMWNTEVQEITGDMMHVTGVKVLNNVTKEQSDIDIGGFFLAIGHDPVSDFFKDVVKLNDQGYIDSPDGVHTSVEGVFSAGDVQDSVYRQAVYAAGMGAAAALAAQKYMVEKGM